MIRHPSIPIAHSHIHHTNSPSAIPRTPNVQWILLRINIDSCGLFARRMAIWLHIIAGLQNQLALARDEGPNQTAGKGSLERTVAQGTADVRI